MGHDELIERLRGKAREGRAVIGAGAGTGLSAKCAEAGGIDLIVIYNSGRFRMAGRGSLAGMMPYGDANGIVLDMAREVLPVVRRTPVLAGVCAWSQYQRDWAPLVLTPVPDCADPQLTTDQFVADNGAAVWTGCYPRCFGGVPLRYDPRCGRHGRKPSPRP